MNSAEDIWQSVLSLLKESLTPVAISTWFDECRVVDINESSMVLMVPSDFKRKIIESRFKDAVQKALNEIFSGEFDVILVGEADASTYEAPVNKPSDLGGSDYYTFENFIVGPSNSFAHAAAKAVAEEQTKAYNPLFIYGESGLGKTHLLYAIRHEIQRKHPDYNIVFVRGNDFMNELITAIQMGRNIDFREKYRSADLFLMDDIQIIAGKNSTQEEFFHTFNNIYESGHQIVITSDRPPIDMLKLDDRLRTRFEGGLMADVQPPDVETRMAIIRNKAGQLGMSLSEEVVQHIADKVTSNIRQIEGVVKRLTAFREITDGAITVNSVNRAIKDVIRVGTYTPTPDDIIEESARYYSVTPEDIKGQRRSKNIAMARHVSAYLIRNLTNLSLNDIGAVFEDRNHATILSSIRKIENMIKTDPDTGGAIRDITSNINSRQR